MTTSRNLGRKHSDETKAKMRAARLGKKHSEETKAILSAKSLGRIGGGRPALQHTFMIDGVALPEQETKVFLEELQTAQNNGSPVSALLEMVNTRRLRSKRDRPWNTNTLAALLRKTRFVGFMTRGLLTHMPVRTMEQGSLASNQVGSLLFPIFLEKPSNAVITVTLLKERKASLVVG